MFFSFLLIFSQSLYGRDCEEISVISDDSWQNLETVSDKPPSDFVHSELGEKAKGLVGAKEMQSIVEAIDREPNQDEFLKRVLTQVDAATLVEKKAAILLLTQNWGYASRYHEATRLGIMLQNFSLLRFANFMLERLAGISGRQGEGDRQFLKLFYDISHTRKYFWEWLRSSNREGELILAIKTAPKSLILLEVIEGLQKTTEESFRASTGFERRKLRAKSAKLNALHRALAMNTGTMQKEARLSRKLLADSFYAKIVPEVFRSEETLSKMAVIIALAYWGVYGSYTFIADPSRPPLWSWPQPPQKPDVTMVQLTPEELRMESARKELLGIEDAYFGKSEIQGEAYQQRLNALLVKYPELSWE